MTPEKKIELLKNLNKSFIPMQSGSSRYGYQKNPVIDEALLQEVLEEIINAMIVDTISIAPEELSYKQLSKILLKTMDRCESQ